MKTAQVIKALLKPFVVLLAISCGLTVTLLGLILGSLSVLQVGGAIIVVLALYGLASLLAGAFGEVARATGRSLGLLVKAGRRN